MTQRLLSGERQSLLIQSLCFFFFMFPFVDQESGVQQSGDAAQGCLQGHGGSDQSVSAVWDSDPACSESCILRYLHILSHYTTGHQGHVEKKDLERLNSMRKKSHNISRINKNHLNEVSNKDQPVVVPLVLDPKENFLLKS